jgi:4-hydroxy-tetrahydrodipicolinate synthase
VNQVSQTMFGLSAALISPFSTRDVPDLPRLARHAGWVLANGCDSLTLFGTTGEGFSIPLRERAAMLGAVLGAGVLPDRVNLAVAAATVADAADQANLGLDAGVAHLLFTPPFYLKAPDEEGIYAWFSRAFETIGAPLRDVILYHIPGQTAVSLSPELVTRLRRAFPAAVVGIKDSSGDWPTTERFLEAHGDIAVLVGDERLLPRAMAQGAQGSICGLANFAPELLRPVIHAGADEPRLKPVVDLVVSNPVMPAVKALVAHRHGDPAYARSRPPLVDLDPIRAAALVRDFEFLMSGAAAA